MKTEAIVESSGNVFADLGFSPEEATLLAMRAELMAHLRETIARNGWTQAQAAQHLAWASPGYRTWCAASTTSSASTCW